MENIKENIKKELDELHEEGLRILYHEDDLDVINNEYQSWYTRALNAVEQLIPERYAEFKELYEKSKPGKPGISIANFLLEFGNSGRDAALLTVYKSKFKQQLAILGSAQDKIDSILADIKGVLQYELFDNELEAAEELLKNGYLRPAGALAGVTLETHLSKVMENHNLKITKTNPSISDFNDELKKNNVYDIPNWRFIQRLGDIRNLCVHKRTRDPKKEEIRELIDGVKKIIKIIF